MKKLTLILALCLLLCACAPQAPAETTAPTTLPEQTEAPSTAAPTEVPASTEVPQKTVPETTEAAVWKFDLYTPDENAMSFYVTTLVITGNDPQEIVNELIAEKALNEDVEINSAVLEGTQLNLDFNQAFLNQLCTYGTAGERMMIGSVVNTFLSAYGAESVFITVEGEIMESGHVIYDFPLEHFE